MSLFMAGNKTSHITTYGVTFVDQNTRRWDSQLLTVFKENQFGTEPTYAFSHYADDVTILRASVSGYSGDGSVAHMQISAEDVNGGKYTSDTKLSFVY